MTPEDQQRRQEAERLYERYGKPLEDEHSGEYVAITRDGRTMLGATLLDVLEKAKAAFGPDNFVFKVGQRAVGSWR